MHILVCKKAPSECQACGQKDIVQVYVRALC